MAYRIVISEHARIRLRERAENRISKREIERRLENTLRLGVKPGPDLAVRVYMPDGYCAVCYPSQFGGWVVATVLSPEMREGVAG